MPLKLYCDLMSQPSRALYIALKKSNCNFEPHFVDLRKGEHFGKEFTKINRIQRVPVIDHDGFILTESVAILRYLRDVNLIPDNLYPKETKRQARVDEYLNWHHIGLRLHCSLYFRAVVIDPLVTGQESSPARVQGWLTRMESALEVLDTKWLGRGTDFILGDEPTVADLMTCCEIEQPRMAGYDPKEKFTNIGVWAKKVQEYFNPYYDEAHVILNKIGNKRKTAKL